MSFVHTTSSRVLANAGHVSGQISQWTVRNSRSLGTASNLLSSGTQWTPGQIGGTVTLRGMFSAGTDELTSIVNAAVGVDDGLVTTVLPTGLTVGTVALMSAVDVENFTINASTDATVMMEMSGQPDNGVDVGRALAVLAARTADGQGTAVDASASTSGGGVGHLHVSTFTGFSSVIFKIQHSTDNSIWTDLLSFTGATATTYERKVFTGTINRYTRALWDVTGTGSVTFAMAMARR